MGIMTLGSETLVEVFSETLGGRVGGVKPGGGGSLVINVF